MVFKTTGILSVVSLLLFLSYCSPNKQQEEKQIESLKNDIQYSAFFEHKERDWTSLELALKKPKYDGMVEVSKFVGQKQTQEQKQRADDLYNRTLQNIKDKGWYELDRAVAAGYDYQNTTHAHNLKYIFDGEFLNPEEPEYLMFYDVNGEKILAGVMFVQDDIGMHGEQIGGHETVWHFHHYPDGKCIPIPADKARMLKNKVDQGDCEIGVLLNNSPQMLHVWFVDHPGGRFSSSMNVENEVILNTRVF